MAHETVSVTGNTTRNLTFPAGTDVSGGPLETSFQVAANNWTVYAHIKTGTNAGKLAHPGVKSNPAGQFKIALPDGGTYDLLGYPSPGEPYSLQILYENVQPGGADPGQHTVREGRNFSGQVTVGGTGSPGATIDLVDYNDPRMTFQGSSTTGGNFQILVRPEHYSIDVLPSAAAFVQGACGYMNPQYSLWTDKTATIDLKTGGKVVFTGQLLTTGGGGVSDANVRLFLVPSDVVEQDISICDPAPVQTDANGSFSITCNLLP